MFRGKWRGDSASSRVESRRGVRWQIKLTVGMALADMSLFRLSGTYVSSLPPRESRNQERWNGERTMDRGRKGGRELNRCDWIARRQSGLSQRRLGNCDNVIRLISDKGAVRVAEFIVELGIEILRRAQSPRVCRELRRNEIWLAKSRRGISFHGAYCIKLEIDG